MMIIQDKGKIGGKACMHDDNEANAHWILYGYYYNKAEMKERKKTTHHLVFFHLCFVSIPFSGPSLTEMKLYRNFFLLVCVLFRSLLNHLPNRRRTPLVPTAHSAFILSLLVQFSRQKLVFAVAAPPVRLVQFSPDHFSATKARRVPGSLTICHCLLS